MTRWICSFFALWLCLAFVHQSRFDGATPLSRLDLLFAFVSHGTLAIDRYHANTPDKAIHRGVYYSDKAPGTALLALPAFALAYAVERQLGRSDRDRPTWLACSWAACAFSQALPAAIGGLLLLAWLRRRVARHAACVTVVGLWLGSLPLPYSTMLFSHAQVIGLISIAVWALDLFATPSRAGEVEPVVLQHPSTIAANDALRPTPAAEPPQERGLQSAGSHAAAGTSLEPQRGRAGTPLPAGGARLLPSRASAEVGSARGDARPTGLKVATPGLGANGTSQALSQRRYALAGMCLGLALASEYTAGLVVLGLAWYVATRRRAGLPVFALGFAPAVLLIPLYSWLTIGTPLGLPYSLQASFPEMAEGWYAIRWPDFENLTRLLFGPTRGLVFWTPFLLLAPFGWWTLFQRQPKWLWLTYALPLLQVVIISGRTWDWQAGYTLSARYLAPVLPLLALPCALGVARLPRVALVLAAVSVLLTTLATVTDACPIYSIWNPLTGLHLPRLLNGTFSPNLASQVWGLPPFAGLAVFCGCAALAIAGLWRASAFRAPPPPAPDASQPNPPPVGYRTNLAPSPKPRRLRSEEARIGTA